MLLTIDMKDACNDNEELSFISLAAATANVIRWLQAEEPDQSNGAEKQRADYEKKERDKRERADIERRIRDILAMEDRLRRKTI